ncbi:MAG: pyridoxamine 5-phosphate oxidase-like protein, partial [Ilumatobacteraceae bacterium]|nr:pyridoxamine 5-phosphate oxidase-like protein [Ilumatobacteraceae bacterium]
MTDAAARLGSLAAFSTRLAETDGFEEVVDAALDAIVELFGHRHVLLLLHEPVGGRLVTFASRGYDTLGIGSEVLLGHGVIGTAAAGRKSMRIGNLQRMLHYLRTVQRAAGPDVPGAEIHLPGLVDARSQLAAPLVVRRALLGIIAVESTEAMTYDEVDEQVLEVAAGLVAAMLDLERRDVVDEPDDPPVEAPRAAPR